MEIKGVELRFLGHAGFLVRTKGGQVIIIDPYNLEGEVEKADLVLITHSHFDHCSIKDLEKVVREGTRVVVPADAQSKITKLNDVDMQIVEVGDELKFGEVKVEAVPAYNVGKDFHPKSEGWMGYVLKLGEVVIYHAGDTDKIPEMEKLTGYGHHNNFFIALLPVSGTYVMNAEEAAEVASLLSPDLAIPMHYGAGVAGTLEDAQKFVELCKEKGIKAEILEKNS
ncbi:MBL fold metallo-hydrolase [Candidatus Pacearchaeota archaeon]|nr:MAG: MBL fold metallo-hydrolase [Candidatus Pacearchaeota archaeon]